MNRTLQILGKQHQEVLARLAATREVLQERTNFQDFLVFLEGEVLGHFALEEKALFPLLEAIPPVAGGPLVVMNREHEGFRNLLRELDGSIRRGDITGQRSAVADLIDLLRAHIAKEDGVLFPMADRFLDSEQQRGMDSTAVRLGLLSDQAEVAGPR